MEGGNWVSSRECDIVNNEGNKCLSQESVNKNDTWVPLLSRKLRFHQCHQHGICLIGKWLKVFNKHTHVRHVCQRFIE